jgi:hypothetical protein
MLNQLVEEHLNMQFESKITKNNADLRILLSVPHYSFAFGHLINKTTIENHP